MSFTNGSNELDIGPSGQKSSSMFDRFGPFLKELILLFEHSCHITGQEHLVSTMTNQAERAVEIKIVGDHSNSVGTGLEVVVVVESLECAAYHAVSKVARSVVHGDA